MENEPLGPSEFFTGAMSTTITHNTKQINILDDAVFDTLEMMFKANTTDTARVDTEADGIALPALATLQNVKSFKLTSGTIQVIYYASV